MPFGEPEGWRQGRTPIMTVVDEIDWFEMPPDEDEKAEEWGNHDPCSAGHVCSDAVEYVDGVVAASCLVCGTRVLLPSVPGGVTLMRAKALFEKLLKLRDEDSAKTSNPVWLANVSGMLEELSDLVIALAHERVKMNEVGKLLDYCKSVVRQLESADD